MQRKFAINVAWTESIVKHIEHLCVGCHIVSCGESGSRHLNAPLTIGIIRCSKLPQNAALKFGIVSTLTRVELKFHSSSSSTTMINSFGSCQKRQQMLKCQLSVPILWIERCRLQLTNQFMLMDVLYQMLDINYIMIDRWWMRALQKWRQTSHISLLLKYGLRQYLGQTKNSSIHGKYIFPKMISLILGCS